MSSTLKTFHTWTTKHTRWQTISNQQIPCVHVHRKPLDVRSCAQNAHRIRKNRCNYSVLLSYRPRSCDFISRKYCVYYYMERRQRRRWWCEKDIKVRLGQVNNNKRNHIEIKASATTVVCAPIPWMECESVNRMCNTIICFKCTKLHTERVKAISSDTVRLAVEKHRMQTMPD